MLRLKNITIEHVLWGIIVTTILTVNIFRFAFLDQVPNGMHVDETGSALSISCIAKEGIGGRGRPYPIFDDLSFGTPKPAMYTFGGIIWVNLFGNSPAAIRALSGFWTCFGIIGIFLVGQLIGGWRVGIFSALCASISPWAWIFSRIAFESILGPCFFIWGFFFLIIPKKWFNAIISGILFSFSMYCYPPMRMLVPLSLIIFLFTIPKIQKQNFSWKYILLFSFSLIIISLPVIHGTLTNSLGSRFNQISVFSPQNWETYHLAPTWINKIIVITKIYASHLTPYFLFYKGSSNLMYSTTFPGQILSWLDTFALLGSITLAILLKFNKKFKRQKLENSNFLKLFFILIALGILPSALTIETPHTLRVLIVWPIVMLISGILLNHLYQQHKFILNLIVIISVLFSSLYLYDYFHKYKKISKGMFVFWLKDQAKAAKNQLDWAKIISQYYWSDIHVRYYLMYYGNDTCMGSYEHWEKVRNWYIKILKDRGTAIR